MDTVPGLKALQAHKRELLVESELNRQLLRLECARLSFEAGRFQRGYSWAKTAWTWAAPVAGFLLARKRSKVAGAFANGSFWLTALRAGWKVWAAMRGARAEPHPDR